MAVVKRILRFLQQEVPFWMLDGRGSKAGSKLRAFGFCHFFKYAFFGPSDPRALGCSFFEVFPPQEVFLGFGCGPCEAKKDPEKYQKFFRGYSYFLKAG